jgi:hypothetical protein
MQYDYEMVNGVQVPSQQETRRSTGSAGGS